MFTRTASLLLSILTVAAGCAGDLDVGPEGESGPLSTGGDAGLDGAGDEGGAAEDDAAFKPQSDEPPPEALLACELDFACEHPLELVRSDKAQAYAESDTCALQALAAGRIALVQTVALFPDAEAYLDHVIDASGSVLRQAHGVSDDVGLWQKPVERCSLQVAAFFSDCAANYDPRCLDPEQWIVPGSCEPLGSLTCPAP